ncbi:hypothetical protein C8Q77DRAFT_1108863 [Trametes polyzona]|nr:hypothetical protein C8Q77DRAFT_1108863 [Trametes polyzona]
MATTVVDDADGNPPWYARDSQGRIRYSEVLPDRLLHHPELRKRGIVPAAVLKPGVVFCTVPPYPSDPCTVVKILDSRTEEQALYEELLSDLSSPNNHTIPAEVTSPEHHPLLIMPRLVRLRWAYDGTWRDPLVLFDIVYQLLEGLDYLHDSHIAHLDICYDNVVAAGGRSAAQPGIVNNRIYFIDFGSAKRFKLGPGVQPSITLSATQLEPPKGLTYFDPYSWDVYCLGRTVIRAVSINASDGLATWHWLVHRYVQWLIGNERGCTGVCRCRPTARTALRVAGILRWVLRAEAGYYWAVHALFRLFSRRY